eukprot:2279992-Pyramimonas_sp.AAC.1
MDICNVRQGERAETAPCDVGWINAARWCARNLLAQQYGADSQRYARPSSPRMQRAPPAPSSAAIA